jgi:hypothetical protein
MISIGKPTKLISRSPPERQDRYLGTLAQLTHAMATLTLEELASSQTPLRVAQRLKL